MTVLDNILSHKAEEVSRLKATTDINDLHRQAAGARSCPRHVRRVAFLQPRADHCGDQKGLTVPGNYK